MRLTVDAPARSAAFSVPRRAYSADAVRIAAHVFADKAEVYARDGRAARELTLVARRALDADALRALAGDFHNELLNQEYRILTARFHRRTADFIVAQTLLAARGGENPASAPPETAEFKAEAERLMAEAAEEIARTMPRRLPPQGPPIPPERA